jgi:hypothetical protein
MADLWTGFDLNEPGAEVDDDDAAFDLDEHKDGDGNTAFHLDEPEDDDGAAAFDLNMPPMEDQNNNGNGLSFYYIHSSHAKVLRASR